jgi:poly(3-hydroxybutyrate) depolymerase
MCALTHNQFTAILIGCFFLFLAATPSVVAQAPQTLNVRVDGIQREALLFPGNQTLGKSTPLVLAFHGYGGESKGLKNPRRLSERLNIHMHWPDSIVVYCQGLIIPQRNDGRIKPGNEKPGWQRTAAMDGGRDLRYVDALIEAVDDQLQMDRKRVFATGYSNGAVFTWVLLKARPNTIAGFAPIGGIDNGNIANATVPRPVIFHFGEKDNAFKLAWAQKSVRRVKRLNKSTAKSRRWSTNSVWFEYEKGGAPFVWHLHPRGHEIPLYASANIVRFFREVSP